jgi:hypothetical protein
MAVELAWEAAKAAYRIIKDQEWFEDNEWHGLLSSNVMAFRYDGSTLYLRFKGNRDYSYQAIPRDMVQSLINASSPGRWFQDNLKGAPAQRL